MMECGMTIMTNSRLLKRISIAGMSQPLIMALILILLLLHDPQRLPVFSGLLPRMLSGEHCRLFPNVLIVMNLSGHHGYLREKLPGITRMRHVNYLVLEPKPGMLTIVHRLLWPHWMLC